MIRSDNTGIGSIVEATMGRDKNKFFVVVGIIDENHVLIADGNSRTIDKPKKKKLKHLKGGHKVSLEIRDRIIGGIRVFDAEIRKILKDFESKSKQEGGSI